MRRLQVAIDGPAGAGKSTVARALAKRLGYLLVDTGAVYRTVALAARRQGIDWADGAGLGTLSESLVKDGRIRMLRTDDMPPQTLPPPPSTGLSPGVAAGSGMRVYLDDEDVSLAIRAPEMSMGASQVSAVPAVRAALLDLQRQSAVAGGVVLEGRDIGTVVLPSAEVKFFLTAAPEVRAKRRYDELVARGDVVTLEDTLRDVVARDRADTERAVAPLRQAEDAVFVDSSGKTIAEIVSEMADVVAARLA